MGSVVTLLTFSKLPNSDSAVISFNSADMYVDGGVHTCIIDLIGSSNDLVSNVDTLLGVPNGCILSFNLGCDNELVNCVLYVSRYHSTMPVKESAF